MIYYLICKRYLFCGKESNEGGRTLEEIKQQKKNQKKLEQNRLHSIRVFFFLFSMKPKKKKKKREKRRKNTSPNLHLFIMPTSPPSFLFWLGFFVVLPPFSPCLLGEWLPPFSWKCLLFLFLQLLCFLLQQSSLLLFFILSPTTTITTTITITTTNKKEW